MKARLPPSKPWRKDCGMLVDGKTANAAAAEPFDMDAFVLLNNLTAGQRRLEKTLNTIQQDLTGLSDRLWRGSVRSNQEAEHHPLQIWMPGDQTEGTGEATADGRSSWPESVMIRPGFEFRCRGALPQPLSVTETFRSAAVRPSSISEESSSQPSTWMVHPTSTLRAVWNLLSVICLLHDVTVVPVLLAWGIQVEGWMLVVAWASCTFWTLDLAMSFVTGFQHKGRLEMNFYKVARRYLTTWFVPESVIVGVDLTNLIAGLIDPESRIGSASSMRILRFSKALKLLRVLGALRVMKISALIKEQLEQRLSGALTIMVQCGVLCGCAIWLSHILGCIWFAVGRLAPSDTGNHWVYNAGWDWSDSKDEEDLMYQYATAVHWAFAQFTLGAMEIPCTNSWERLFNVLCLLLGLIFGSTLVSSLSATMVDYHMRIIDRTDKLRRLARFLRENQVCHELSFHVQQQAIDRLNTEQRLKEEDVKALSMLSRSLRAELRFEICNKHLHHHPLFSLWVGMDPDFMQRFCTQAVTYTFPRALDEVFAGGTITNCMYYNISGVMEYRQDPALVPVQESVPEMVSDGTWISEASLWARWTHVGTCKAVSACEMFSISAEDMLKLCQRRSSVVAEVAAEYCRTFHKKILAARPNWPTDLLVPKSDFANLLLDMDLSVRTKIGMTGVDQLRVQAYKSRQQDQLDQLDQEVTLGRSCVYLGADGNFQRVVATVEARLLREDGCILVDVAKQFLGDGKRLEAACKLPRCKTEHGENAVEAFKRLLGQLGMDATDIEEQSFEEEVKETESRKFKIRTLCFLSVFSGVTQKELSLPVTTFTGRTNGPRSQSFQRMASPTSLQRRSSAFSLGPPCRRSASMGRTVSMDETKNFFFRETSNKKHFYTWMPVGKFNYWRTAGGKKDLQEWLSTVKISGP